jgi:hypothetical protein
MSSAFRESDISVTCRGDPAVPVDRHIHAEVQRYSNLVGQNPRAGGPLTMMERGILFAYLRDALLREAAPQKPPEKA